MFVVNRPDYFISHRIKIAEKLIEMGFDVHVASVYHSSVTQLEKYGCKFHNINLERGDVNPFNILKSITNLTRLLKDINPDVFHCITMKPVVVGGLSAWFCKVNMISSIAGMGSVFTTKSIKNSFLKGLVYFVYP